VKNNFYLFFITFVIIGGLIVIAVLSYLESNPFGADAKLEPKVLSTLTSADKKIQEAQKLLSKNAPTTENQNKAKQLIEEAITEAKKATEEQPNNPQTWLFLALVYKQLITVNSAAGELAEEALKKALDLSPENTKLYDELATIYILSEKYKEAEDTLFEAIERDPNGANHYFKLGNVYKELNRDDDARKNYLKAKDLIPPANATASAMIEAQLRSLEN
jgi:Flp pilus assembly protein TadD